MPTLLKQSLEKFKINLGEVLDKAVNDLESKKNKEGFRSDLEKQLEEQVNLLFNDMSLGISLEKDFISGSKILYNYEKLTDKKYKEFENSIEEFRKKVSALYKNFGEAVSIIEKSVEEKEKIAKSKSHDTDKENNKKRIAIKVLGAVAGVIVAVGICATLFGGIMALSTVSAVALTALTPAFVGAITAETSKAISSNLFSGDGIIGNLKKFFSSKEKTQEQPEANDYEKLVSSQDRQIKEELQKQADILHNAAKEIVEFTKLTLKELNKNIVDAEKQSREHNLLFDHKNHNRKKPCKEVRESEEPRSEKQVKIDKNSTLKSFSLKYKHNRKRDRINSTIREI